MRKPIILFIALALTLCIALSKNKVEKTDSSVPQWYSQWFEMKKNIHGQIPTLMNHRWAMNDAFFNKTNSALNLDSVKNIGPDNVGGRTRGIIVDLEDTTHYFAGSVSGGLWESKDEGLSWKPVNDNQENLNITAITQSPFNKKVYYYSTGEAYPTVDLSNNTGGQMGGGVFRSTDGGVSFNLLSSTLNSNFTSTWDIKHSLTDSNTLFVATNNNGLFRSTDGGVSFINVFATNKSVTRIEIIPDGSILIACSTQGIYKSATGNPGSFIKISNSFATPSGVIDFCFCKNFPNIMYALVSSNSNASLLGAYKTSDGGNNWHSIGFTSFIGYNSTDYSLVIAVSPTDTNRIFTGSVNPGYSINGGTNWGIGSQLNGHADYHRTFQVPGTNKFLVSNDGGVYRSTWNSPLALISLNNGYSVTQYYNGSFFKSGISAIMGSQDCGTHRILDANKQAVTLYGADGCFTAINQLNDSNGYYSWQNGNIYKAGNLKTGLSNISAVNFNPSDNKWFITPFEINPLDWNQIYVPSKEHVFRSTGGTFIYLTYGQLKQPYSIAVSNENNPTLYYGGSEMLLCIVNNALTATPGNERLLTLSKPASLVGDFVGCIKIHPSNKNTIFITLTNYNSEPRVWKITHTESTPVWTNISGNLPLSLPCNSFEVDPANPDTKFFVATDFGLYTTDDGGVTWVKENRIPNVCINSIKVRPDDRKLFIFTHGRGIWVANVLPYPLLSPTANFKLPNGQICEGEQIDFTDSSTNSPSQISWTFENGTPATSSTAKATTIFYGSGLKKIKLVVKNQYGTDSTEKTIQVYANPKPMLTRNVNQLFSSSGVIYSWYRNNKLIAQTTQIVSADTGGWYKVSVKNLNGCLNISDSLLVFSAGIKGYGTSGYFFFSPNPADRSLTVFSKVKAEITIYSMDGKPAGNYLLNANSSNVFDISSFVKGIYILVYKSGNETVSKKFIKL